MQHPHRQTILTAFRQHLVSLYGDRLEQLILFGSQSQGDATPNSDIDVLIVLRQTFDWGQERKRISNFIVETCLDYETLGCFVLMESSEFHHKVTPLLLNMRREGIAV